MGKHRLENTVKGIDPERRTNTPPEWGTLKPEEWRGKATLMRHDSFGRRWIPNDLVEAKKKRNWRVVGDEVNPIAAPEPEPKPAQPLMSDQDVEKHLAKRGGRPGRPRKTKRL